MCENETTGRTTHPADPELPEQRGVTDAGDDLWESARTDAPHTVVPADDDVRRWAWRVTG